MRQSRTRRRQHSLRRIQPTRTATISFTHRLHLGYKTIGRLVADLQLTLAYDGISWPGRTMREITCSGWIRTFRVEVSTPRARQLSRTGWAIPYTSTAEVPLAVRSGA